MYTTKTSELDDAASCASSMMNLKRVLSSSFVAGVLGGVVVLVVAIVTIALAGVPGFSTKGVTVLQAPSVPADAFHQTRTQTVRQIYTQDAPGVVLVNAVGVSGSQSPSEYLKGEGGQRGTATGSGFEIDSNGSILTNWHVVENAVNVTIELERGKTIEAQALGKDPSHDLAVLRIPTSGLTLHPLPLGDSSKAQVGDPVLAIGDPFGLGQTLTTGVISALQRQITAPSGVRIDNVLQTDAPINPGNSGGPLLNEQGQVIGINSQIETSGNSGGNIGIAFAIPINIAKSELSKLEAGKP